MTMVRLLEELELINLTFERDKRRIIMNWEPSVEKVRLAIKE